MGANDILKDQMTRSEAIAYGNERVSEFIAGMRKRIIDFVPKAEQEDQIGRAHV